MPDLKTPLEEKIDALIEEHGFAEVRKAVETWHSSHSISPDPLPETVTVEQMKSDPHQSHGG